MNLHTISENYTFHINNLNHSGCEDVDDYLYLKLSHRIVGICSLLLHSDVKKFRTSLSEAGNARLKLLRFLKETNQSHAALCISKDFTLPCVIAIGDFKLAKEIINEETQELQAEYEYEEDFYSRLFIHTLVSQPTNKEELTKISQKLSTLLEKEDLFLSFCSICLEGKDPDAEQWLRKYVKLRKEELREIKKQPTYDEEMYLLEKKISIEALSYYQLLKSLNFALPDELPLIPAISIIDIEDN